LGGELNPVDLARQDIGLFLDVDGTLLDLAPRPDAVEVPAGLREALAGAEQRLDGALALVSGRAIDTLDRLFHPLRLRASGLHGAEIRHSADAPATCLTPAELPERAWLELLRLLEDFPGTLAENKAVGFAVHYRLSPVPPETLRAALERFADSLPEYGLRVRHGRRVFEIGPTGLDKGTAIQSFMKEEPFARRRPVFVADDRMDWPGFEAALAHGGFAFSVGEALPGLSGWFDEPEAVRAWVGMLAR